MSDLFIDKVIDELRQDYEDSEVSGMHLEISKGTRDKFLKISYMRIPYYSVEVKGE